MVDAIGTSSQLTVAHDRSGLGGSRPVSVARRASPDRRPPVDRSGDRWIALASLVAAFAFLAAALATLALPDAGRRGLWLPLHLALAGGATTAIAGVMPFFVAAFAAARPAPALLRSAAVGLVALGAATPAATASANPSTHGFAGGVTFMAGVIVTGLAAVVPLLRALGASRGLVTQAYLLGLAEVSIGAALGTLYFAAWPPVLAAWERLKVGHAWLNLLGFLSLTIATTLLHFFPTVVGTRIGAGLVPRAVVVCLGGGPILVAGAVIADAHVIARLGGVVSIAGSIALVAYAARTWRTRTRWTNALGWHRFVTGGLVSAMVWVVVGMTVAAGRVVLLGSAPSGWSLKLVAAPLVIGWVGLVVISSATHLVPAVGPGNHETHRRQRDILGIAATARLAAANAGVAALVVAGLLEIPALVPAGLIGVGLSFGLTAALLVASLLVVMREHAGSGPDS